MNKILQSPDIRQRFEQNGLEIAGGAPEKLGAIIKRVSEKISKLAKMGALRVE